MVKKKNHKQNQKPNPRHFPYVFHDSNAVLNKAFLKPLQMAANSIPVTRKATLDAQSTRHGTIVFP